MADVTETLKAVTEPVSLDECRTWWNEAVRKLDLSKQMAEIGFAPYDPMPERILRLISALSHETAEYKELAKETQRPA